MSWQKSLSRLRPSPALAVAVLALVLASIGSAAAVKAGAPAGGGAHISKGKPKHKKPPACLSSARSLCSALRQAVDGRIAAYVGAHKSTLRGATGSGGSTGPTGAAGAAGAANGYTDQHPGIAETVTLSESSTVVSTLKLPPGKYIVQADVHLSRLSAETPVLCKLTASTTMDQAAAEIGTSAGFVSVTDVALSGPLTLSSPESVVVRCEPEVLNRAAARATMTAVQVTNVISTGT